MCVVKGQSSANTVPCLTPKASEATIASDETTPQPITQERDKTPKIEDMDEDGIVEDEEDDEEINGFEIPPGINTRVLRVWFVSVLNSFLRMKKKQKIN